MQSKLRQAGCTMKNPSKKQLEKLLELYEEESNKGSFPGTLGEFIDSCNVVLGDDAAIVVKARNQYLVVEDNGYTHT